MKVRLIIFVVVIAVAIGAWLWKQSTYLPKNVLLTATNNFVAARSATPIVTNPAAAFVNGLNTNTLTNAANIAEAYRHHLISKDEAVIRTMLAKNKDRQDFYGKIIDQYGKPIGGVDITGEIVLIENYNSERRKMYRTESDEKGLFQFTGIRGWKFDVQLRKSGYKMGERGKGYQAPVGGKSSPDSRETLTMWKLRGPEPLDYSAIEAKIPHDGTPTSFDITTGRQTPKGDFRVTLFQYPLEIKTGRERFNWAVKVEIPDGGLVEEDDPYPYWAPTDGYQSSFEFDVSSNSPDWWPNLKRVFYIKTAQEHYGLMQLGVFPGRSPTGVEAHFTINPSGSQNLEPGK